MTQREFTTEGWTIEDQVRAERIRTERAMGRVIIFDEIDTYDAAKVLPEIPERFLGNSEIVMTPGRPDHLQVSSVFQAYQTTFAPRVTSRTEGGLTVTEFTRRPGFTRPYDEEAP